MTLRVPELSVIVPCFNEAKRVTSTLDEMLAELPKLFSRSFEIILVDDGSLDGTSAIIESLIAANPAYQLRLIKHQLNLGKGAAVRTGVAASSGAHILMSDADGSTPITEITKLLVEANRGFEIVIGSRAVYDPTVVLKTRLHRKLLGRLFNGVVNFLVLPGIRDTQCGFKLFSRRACAELFPTLEVNHFGFDIELLISARQHGFKISEVAVNWRHVSGSKVNLVTDSAQMLAMVFYFFSKKLW